MTGRRDGPLRRRLSALRPAERVVGGLLLVWAGLGLGHTGLALARGNGWVVERSAAAARTLGLPDEDRAPLVAGVRDALERTADAPEYLVVVLPAAADTMDVIYTRYQLAHLAYPVRVGVVRDTAGAALPEPAPEGTLVVRVPPRAPDHAPPR